MITLEILQEQMEINLRTIENKLDKLNTLIAHGPEVSKGWIWRHLNKWNEFYGFIPITMNDLIIMITEAGVTVKEGE